MFLKGHVKMVLKLLGQPTGSPPLTLKFFVYTLEVSHCFLFGCYIIMKKIIKLSLQLFCKAVL